MDTERIYRLVIENAHDGMFHSDAEGRIVWVNSRLASMLGYTHPGDLIGMPARDLYATPLVRDRLQRQVEEQGKVTEFVAHMKRTDGARIIIEANVSLLRGEGGEAEGVVGVARDITRRVADEERHQQEYELNELVMNTIPAGVLFVNTDGAIRWANAAAFRMCDCRPSELVGRNVFDDAPAWIREQADSVRQVLRTGKLIVGRRRQVDLGASGRNYATVSIAPMRRMGEISGVVVEVVDVSETVHLYEEMLAAERRFRALFDQAPEIYLSVDSHAVIIDCNDTACQQLGHPRDDLIGRPVADVYDASCRDRASKLYREGEVVGLETPVDLVLLTSAGDPLPVTMVGTVVRDESGKVLNAFAVHRSKE